MPCPNHPEEALRLERCSRCKATFCGDCVVRLDGATFCASCKLEHVRDLLAGIVPGALDLGTIFRRFLAMWIDGMVTSIAGYIIAIPLTLVMAAVGGAAGAAGEGASQAVAGVIMVLVMIAFYGTMLGLPVVYEALMLQKKGQTLGKMALGLKVVTPEGGEISKGQAWGRAALRLVLGTCLFIDYVAAFVTRERTCLHDMIAKTRVVKVSS